MSCPAGSSLPTFFESGAIAAAGGQESFAAAPDCPPARFAVGLATEEAAEACEGTQELTDRVERSRFSEHLADDLEPFRRDQLSGGGVGARRATSRS